MGAGILIGEWASGGGDSDWGVGFRGRGFMWERGFWGVDFRGRGFVWGGVFLSCGTAVWRVIFRGRGFLGTAGLLIGPWISGGGAFGLGRLFQTAGLYVGRGFVVKRDLKGRGFVRGVASGWEWT